MSAGKNFTSLKKIRTFNDDVAAIKPNNNLATQTAKQPTVTPEKNNSYSEGQTIFKKPDTPKSYVSKKNTPPKLNPTVAQTNTQNTNSPKTTSQNTNPRPILDTPEATGDSGKFQADIAAVKAIPQEPDSVSVLDQVGETEITGNFVSDKKSTRFQLLPAMWEGIQTWFTNEKEEFEEKSEEKRKAIPTVRDIEGRKSIVEKAAKQSALAPKDDYKKFTANIPKTNQKSTPTPAAITISEKKETKPSWSHFDKDKEDASKQKEPVNTAAEQKIAETKNKLPPVIPAVLKQEPKPEVEPKPQVPETERTPTSKPEKTIKKAPPVKRIGHHTGLLGKVLFYFFLITIGITAVGAGVALVLWIFNKTTDENPPITNTTNTPTLTPEASPSPFGNQVFIQLPQTRIELWNSIKTLGRDDIAVLTLEDSQPASRASAEDVLEVIDLSTSDSFERNVNSLSFGKVQDGLFIMMQINSFDTAFGGMLTAEQQLVSELSLLKKPEQNITATTTYAFEDSLINNRDVRVLKYSSGEEGFIYGFPSKNILLITIDRNTFDTISSQLE